MVIHVWVTDTVTGLCDILNPKFPVRFASAQLWVEVLFRNDGFKNKISRPWKILKADIMFFEMKLYFLKGKITLSLPI